MDAVDVPTSPPPQWRDAGRMDVVVDGLEVRRDDLGITRLVSDAVSSLQAGQVLLRVDRFALTTNNITYGVVGDMIGYWNFFPAPEVWGRIPVWGFADVVESDVAGVTTGTRVFGYLPMASHLVVQPTSVGPNGFADGAAHRVELPSRCHRTEHSIPANRRRPPVPTRLRGRPSGLSPALRHVVHARRLLGRQRGLRR